MIFNNLWSYNLTRLPICKTFVQYSRPIHFRKISLNSYERFFYFYRTIMANKHLAKFVVVFGVGDIFEYAGNPTDSLIATLMYMENLEQIQGVYCSELLNALFSNIIQISNSVPKLNALTFYFNKPFENVKFEFSDLLIGVSSLKQLNYLHIEIRMEEEWEEPDFQWTDYPAVSLDHITSLILKAPLINPLLFKMVQEFDNLLSLTLKDTSSVFTSFIPLLQQITPDFLNEIHLYAIEDAEYHHDSQWNEGILFDDIPHHSLEPLNRFTNLETFTIDGVEMELE